MVGCHTTDLPELESIRLNRSAFRFFHSGDPALVMRSASQKWESGLDLPKLTTVTTSGEYSYSFRYPHHITLESNSLWKGNHLQTCQT